MAQTTVGIRAARKRQTRQGLLDAALTLMAGQSLGSISLREVCREAGIVPAAFYRHFPDMDSLGVALVEQCLGGLRTALRAVRAGRTDSEEIARRSVAALAQQLREHRAQFRFIARERHGGVQPVRQAIRDQLRLFSDELAADLLTDNPTASAVLVRWEPADVRMLADLVVDHMLATAAALLDAPADEPDEERRVMVTATRQLWVIVVGARHWVAR